LLNNVVDAVEVHIKIGAEHSTRMVGHVSRDQAAQAKRVSALNYQAFFWPEELVKSGSLGRARAALHYVVRVLGF
jgi:hypothetical protein